MGNSSSATTESTVLVVKKEDESLKQYKGSLETNGIPREGNGTENASKSEKSQNSECQNMEEKNENESKHLKFSSVPARSKWILAFGTFAMFWVGCSFSLLGPFYTIEGIKKGMSITMTGLVFGIFQLIIFMFSPIFGNFLTFFGARFCYITGFVVGGVCNVLFGTLDKSPDGTPFIAISIAVRAVEALGYAAFITAGFAIVSSEFPKHVGFVYGILETGTGLGFMLGPVIGGGLYELGGYGLPFYFVGVCVLITAVCMLIILPEPHNMVPTRRKASIFTLFRSPLVIAPCLSILLGTIGITVFDATFSKHLEPLGYSTVIVSLFYAYLALVYSILSTVWGTLVDKKDIKISLIIGGHFIFGLGYLIMAPCPWLPFIPFNAWTLVIGMTCVGMTFGCTLIPTMKCIIEGAFDLGFEDNLDTFAMVSGLFNSSFYLGGFIGPLGVGALIDKYDFPIAYSIVGFLHFFGMVVSIIFFSAIHLHSKMKNTMATDCPQQTYFKDVEIESEMNGKDSSHSTLAH